MSILFPFHYSYEYYWNIKSTQYSLHDEDCFNVFLKIFCKLPSWCLHLLVFKVKFFYVVNFLRLEYRCSGSRVTSYTSMPHTHQRARARICPFFPRTHENWVQHPMDAHTHTHVFPRTHTFVCMKHTTEIYIRLSSFITRFYGGRHCKNEPNFSPL